MWVLYEELLGTPEVSSSDSVPVGFCSQEFGDLSSWNLEPGAGVPDVELGLCIPEISLLNFYPPHVVVGPACSASLTLLPVWMDVVSLTL